MFGDKNKQQVFNVTVVNVKIPKPVNYKFVEDGVKNLLEFARVRIYLRPVIYKRVLDDITRLGMTKNPGKYISALIEGHFEMEDNYRQALGKIAALEKQIEFGVEARVIPEERK